FQAWFGTFGCAAVLSFFAGLIALKIHSGRLKTIIDTFRQKQKWLVMLVIQGALLLGVAAQFFSWAVSSHMITTAESVMAQSFTTVFTILFVWCSKERIVPKWNQVVGSLGIAFGIYHKFKSGIGTNVVTAENLRLGGYLLS